MAYPGATLAAVLCSGSTQWVAGNLGEWAQVSFAVSSPQAVRHVWETALSLGGGDEGAPGLRPHYAPDYYGAYCRDPEGNKLCFVYTPEFDNTVGGLA
ncbi:hypothetical protein [Dickeya dadantii]|uniref:hypothetical protein n=1 Tax=Dickeya dadantii TaxID=204038 RepID=UPI001FD2BDBD|nr:hypothetical protein [Dickeya dadantii]